MLHIFWPADPSALLAAVTRDASLPIHTLTFKLIIAYRVVLERRAPVSGSEPSVSASPRRNKRATTTQHAQSNRLNVALTRREVAVNVKFFCSSA